jgi:rhodanese-related sulfurtransferase
MSDLTFVKEPTSGCQFIDVREPAEFNSEKISGAMLFPLSQLHQKLDSLDKNRPLVIVCRTGNRAKRAAEELTKLGFQDVRILEGGIQAWKAAGNPTVKSASRVWAMDRQVRFTAGLLVVVGAIGAWLLHPALLGLSVLVGGGLIFSAVTDTCGLAMLLSKMPWNRVS